ncbi:MAG: 30S ribosomal protein S27ae [bacterium]|nr:30S ribosomal protein S27ae [bacterium]
MGKKKKNPKKPMQIWKVYEAKGELKRKNPSCPKCGTGTFLAAHKDRSTCGKCGYSEMKSKEAKEEKK